MSLNPPRLLRIILPGYVAATFLQLWPAHADYFTTLPRTLGFHTALPDWPTPVILATVLVPAAALAAGKVTRGAALMLWLWWGALQYAHPFSVLPSDPYIGWLLLGYVLFPSARVLRGRAMNHVAWVVAAATYAASAVTKLHHPAWISGEALAQVWAGPLARGEGWAQLPATLGLLGTWATLVVELLPCLALLWPRARRPVCLLLALFHVGIAASLSLLAIPVGMLIHTLALWPAPEATPEPQRDEQPVNDGAARGV